MTIARIVLFPATALALAACAPGGEDDTGTTSPVPGPELAAGGEGPQSAAPQIVNLTPAQLRAKLDEGNIRLIDVRTSMEVAFGVIPGAEHIPVDDFDPAKLDLSDGRKVVLYCRSGNRSGTAAERLSAYTGEPAEHLAGGILAWEDAGEPIE